MNLNWNTTHWTNRQPFAARMAAALEQKAILNARVLLLELLDLRINCRLLLLKFKMFRLYFRSLIRFLCFRCNLSLHLLPQWMQLVAKHGLNWRTCVFDCETVQLLQFERDVNEIVRRPDSDTFCIRTSNSTKEEA